MSVSKTPRIYPWGWFRHQLNINLQIGINKPMTSNSDFAAENSITFGHLDAARLGEIIEMALSDHVSFAQIRDRHGLGPDQVKALMRKNLAPGSYRAWRRRVRRFSDQRATYK